MAGSLLVCEYGAAPTPGLRLRPGKVADPMLLRCDRLPGECDPIRHETATYTGDPEDEQAYLDELLQVDGWDALSLYFAPDSDNQ